MAAGTPHPQPQPQPQPQELRIALVNMNELMDWLRVNPFCPTLSGAFAPVPQ
jgi:hypothetical protein